MKKVGIGIIGLGPRAETLLASLAAMKEEINITAICDLRDDKIALLERKILEAGFAMPSKYHDYRQLIADTTVDAVLIPTSWNSHLQIADGQDFALTKDLLLLCRNGMLHVLPGSLGRIHRHLGQPLCQRGNALHVIHVFVGQEHPCDLLGADFQRIQALDNLRRTDPHIH